MGCSGRVGLELMPGDFYWVNVSCVLAICCVFRNDRFQGSCRLSWGIYFCGVNRMEKKENKETSFSRMFWGCGGGVCGGG